jgi:hypothetical protein
MATKKPTTNELLAKMAARLDDIEAALAAPSAPITDSEPSQVVIVDAPPPSVEAAHNDLVEVHVLTLFHYDGDPATEGTEIYAPTGYEFDDVQREGLHGLGLDDAAIAALPNRFTVTRLVADALVKAGIAALTENQPSISSSKPVDHHPV